jgi:hypothetical protein
MNPCGTAKAQTMRRLKTWAGRVAFVVSNIALFYHTADIWHSGILAYVLFAVSMATLAADVVLVGKWFKRGK